MAVAKRAGDGGSGRSHAIDDEARHAGSDQPIVTLMCNESTNYRVRDTTVNVIVNEPGNAAGAAGAFSFPLSRGDERPRGRHVEPRAVIRHTVVSKRNDSTSHHTHAATEPQKQVYPLA